MVEFAGLGTVLPGGAVGGGMDGVEEGATRVGLGLKATVAAGLFLTQLVVGQC